MAFTSDYQSWILSVESGDFNEVYCLYKALEQLQEWGVFVVEEESSTEGKKYFVKCNYIDKVLLLGSEESRKNFMNHIRKNYAGNMNMEEWYYFKYEMQRKDQNKSN